MCFECVLAYRVSMLLILTAGPSATYPPSLQDPPRPYSSVTRSFPASLHSEWKEKPASSKHATKSQLQSILLSLTRFILVFEKLRGNPSPSRLAVLSGECRDLHRRVSSRDVTYIPGRRSQSAIGNPRIPKSQKSPPTPSPTETV